MGCTSPQPNYVYVPPVAPQAEPARAPEPLRNLDQLSPVGVVENEESASPRRFFWQRAASPEIQEDENETLETLSQDTTSVDEVDEPEPVERRRFLFGRKKSAPEVEQPASPLEAPAIPSPTPATTSTPDAQMEVAGPGTVSSIYRLRPNDAIIVHLRGIPEPANYEMLVDDEGFISLPFIPSIKAAGKTASELQRAIESAYIDGEFYQRITVNIMLPSQSYFVRGEVRAPGRFPLTPGMTLLKAIAEAGGYTEYANPRKVNLLRGERSFMLDAREAERGVADMNVSVEDGDVIVVPRSFF